MFVDKEKKRLMLRQTARLATLGVTVEKARGRLKKLVARGVPYDAPEMLAALERFNQADAEWKQLEREHLALKEKLTSRPDTATYM